MADHAFSNAGLGMFGGDTSIARQAATPDGASEKTKKLLGGLAAGAIDAVGLKDFFDKLGGSDGAAAPSVPPSAVPAPNPAYGIAPPAPISAEGINPMRLPNAVPGGVGLNAQPVGAMNPFQFKTTPAPQLTPDDEHRNQVKSAWS